MCFKFTSIYQDIKISIHPDSDADATIIGMLICSIAVL